MDIYMMDHHHFLLIIIFLLVLFFSHFQFSFAVSHLLFCVFLSSSLIYVIYKKKNNNQIFTVPSYLKCN